MGLDDEMANAVDALYAAAAGQSDWHAALDRVLDATGFTHASVYAIDRHVRAAATDDYRLPVSGFWHRLVERLIGGDTPEQAAQALGVGIPTVRSQLASIFRKTETERQSELIRVLVSLPRWASPADTSAGGRR